MVNNICFGPKNLVYFMNNSSFMLIDGREIARNINKKTAFKLKKLKNRGFTPKIIVFLVGSHKASEVYVRQKERLAKQVGFGFELKHFPATISQSKLTAEILRVQNNREISGIILQLPLPPSLNAYKALACLLPEHDIDCLSDINLGRLILNNYFVEPPTAGAILEIIRHLKINLSGKKITVIGSGLLVGKPLVMMLMNAKATVVVCNSSTKNLARYCREADIIISGAGQNNLLKAGMVKKNSVVIDAGFSYKGGKIFGDAEVNRLDKKGAKVTPTPGGVGPVTVAKLMHNAAICAERKFSEIKSRKK